MISISRIKNILENTITEIEHTDSTARVRTGFSDFDKITGGLRAGELVVIEPRPGMGKSTLGLNIAHHTTVQKKKLPQRFFLLNCRKIKLRAPTLCRSSRRCFRFEGGMD